MADFDVELVDLVYELDADEPTVEVVDDFVLVLDTAGASTEQTVVNRVWDTVAAAFVRWETAAADSSGASYPGPGTFGVNTSGYVVEITRTTGA